MPKIVKFNFKDPNKNTRVIELHRANSPDVPYGQTTYVGIVSSNGVGMYTVSDNNPLEGEISYYTLVGISQDGDSGIKSAISPPIEVDLTPEVDNGGDRTITYNISRNDFSTDPVRLASTVVSSEFNVVNGAYFDLDGNLWAFGSGGYANSKGSICKYVLGNPYDLSSSTQLWQRVQITYEGFIEDETPFQENIQWLMWLNHGKNVLIASLGDNSAGSNILNLNHTLLTCTNPYDITDTVQGDSSLFLEWFRSLGYRKSWGSLNLSCNPETNLLTLAYIDWDTQQLKVIKLKLYVDMFGILTTGASMTYVDPDAMFKLGLYRLLGSDISGFHLSTDQRTAIILTGNRDNDPAVATGAIHTLRMLNAGDLSNFELVDSINGVRLPIGNTNLNSVAGCSPQRSDYQVNGIPFLLLTSPTRVVDGGNTWLEGNVFTRNYQSDAQTSIPTIATLKMDNDQPTDDGILDYSLVSYALDAPRGAMFTNEGDLIVYGLKVDGSSVVKVSLPYPFDLNIPSGDSAGTSEFSLEFNASGEIPTNILSMGFIDNGNILVAVGNIPSTLTTLITARRVSVAYDPTTVLNEYMDVSGLEPMMDVILATGCQPSLNPENNKAFVLTNESDSYYLYGYDITVNQALNTVSASEGIMYHLGYKSDGIGNNAPAVLTTGIESTGIQVGTDGLTMLVSYGIWDYSPTNDGGMNTRGYIAQYSLSSPFAFSGTKTLEFYDLHPSSEMVGHKYLSMNSPAYRPVYRRDDLPFLLLVSQSPKTIYQRFMITK